MMCEDCKKKEVECLVYYNTETEHFIEQTWCFVCEDCVGKEYILCPYTLREIAEVSRQ